MKNLAELADLFPSKTPDTLDAGDGTKGGSNMRPEPLRAVLASADRSLSISDTLKAKAAAETLEAELSKQLDDSIFENDAEPKETQRAGSFEEFSKSVETKPLSTGDSTPPLVPDYLNDEISVADRHLTTPDTDERLSARILELHNKQATCNDMKAQIRDSASLLTSLASQADLLGGYLKKAEVELAKLEEVELSSEELSQATVSLNRKYNESKAVIDEQKRELALLNTQKLKLRDTIETARGEIGRLLEDKKAQKSEMAALKAATVLAENEQIKLQDKVASMDREFQERETAMVIQRTEIDKLTNANKDLEKALSKYETKRAEHDRIIEQNTVDLTDMRSKYNNLNTRFLDQKSLLEERSHELDSVRRELEGNILLKDKRIVELEARLEVAVKTLALNEESMETKGDADEPEAKADAEIAKYVPKKHKQKINAAEEVEAKDQQTGEASPKVVPLN